jgi:hypothetical protein
VPIDPSTEPATHDRRTFLTRSAVGGALLSAVALGLPAANLLPAAWAQTSDEDLLTDELFADAATPLELAAVQAYLAAAQSEQLDDEALGWAQTFGTNHQAVADTLATLLGEGAPAPTPDVALTEEWTRAVNAASDQRGVLAVLATVEDALVATHLSAIPFLRDKVTAKTVAQVLSVEAQQGALMTVNSGGSIEEATPAIADTEASLLTLGGEVEDVADADEAAADADAATTTTAAN